MDCNFHSCTDQRYKRNIPALSEEECSLLRTRRVFIAGCGGLGGHLAELMARIGIGAICAVDGDVFEQTNLNRQLLSTPDLIGCEKACAAAQRITAVNPDGVAHQRDLRRAAAHQLFRRRGLLQYR